MTIEKWLLVVGIVAVLDLLSIRWAIWLFSDKEESSDSSKGGK